MLSFGIVVAINNILALKNFSVFLNNFMLFEKPNWLEKRLIQLSLVWLERQAWKNYEDVKTELEKNRFNLLPTKCKVDFWAVLFVANQQHFISIDKDRIISAKELFAAISENELRINRILKPRANEAYK